MRRARAAAPQRRNSPGPERAAPRQAQAGEPIPQHHAGHGGRRRAGSRQRSYVSPEHGAQVHAEMDEPEIEL